MIQEFIEFFDKAAGLPLAVVVSLVFICLTVYLALVTFPAWYKDYHKVIENNTTTTQQQGAMLESLQQATKSSAEATLAVSKSVDMLREFLQERAAKDAVHFQETRELRGDVNQIQEDVHEIQIEVSKLGVQVSNIRG